MSAQHTPGPWLVRPHNDGYQIWHEPGDGLRSRIANVNDFDVCPEHGGTAAENARLIASAPELVAALAGVLAMLELLNAPGTHDPVEARVYAARAALAKARGSA